MYNFEAYGKLTVSLLKIVITFIMNSYPTILNEKPQCSFLGEILSAPSGTKQVVLYYDGIVLHSHNLGVVPKMNRVR